ncbi:thioredoxin-like domain-containing protein [Ditylenchus destructor]|uniref:Thioredoxin-like domain-containing protein n=1 Tax=Ditylenchus destructor TaxID=166010 RepID=A0AAD4MTC2_9BILA|nr:thioredoxin-like domain-containing protein [Ditylenchus destructor]
MAQLLQGSTLVLSDDSKVQAESHLSNKIVALYFSAGWCPPCRNFTPKLKRFYEVVKKAGKNFEVVFVSRDRAAEDLVEYYKDHHGEWTYLEFGDPHIQEFLEKYEIKTIPALKVIKPDGTVVVNDARTEVVDKGAENPLALFEEWEAFYES